MSKDTKDLRNELEEKPTAELVSILRNRDEEEWRPEVFDVVASILTARGVSPGAVIDMGPEGVDVVESAPTVTVARFFTPAECHAARMALEEAGIPAWVADEEGGTLYGAGIGARLQVRLEDRDAAREVLAEAPVSAEGLPAELAEPPCPACGSKNVASEARPIETDAPSRWGQPRRKWYYVCSDCHTAWPA
jgi:putative signal transducing protein